MPLESTGDAAFKAYQTFIEQSVQVQAMIIIIGQVVLAIIMMLFFWWLGNKFLDIQKASSQRLEQLEREKQVLQESSNDRAAAFTLAINKLTAVIETDQNLDVQHQQLERERLLAYQKMAGGIDTLDLHMTQMKGDLSGQLKAQLEMLEGISRIVMSQASKDVVTALAPEFKSLRSVLEPLVGALEKVALLAVAIDETRQDITTNLGGLTTQVKALYEKMATAAPMAPAVDPLVTVASPSGAG